MFRIICFIFLFSHAVVSSIEDENMLLDKSINALNKTLNFVLQYYEAMNVDGIFGITQGEAHLIDALSKTEDPVLKEKITELIEKSQKIYELQLPNLRNEPYKYYVFNYYILPPEIWLGDINFTYGKLNPNPKVDTGPYDINNLMSFWKYVSHTTFSEEQSDACLVEVAVATNNTQPHDCPMSTTCRDYMFTMPSNYSDRFPGYGVTHMLLYIQIAKIRNCNMDKEKIDELINQECSYILWELRKNIEHGYIRSFDDLLLEQVAMCGREGFAEFLELSILEHVLEMQELHGGFGVDYSLESIKKSTNTKRRKRESDLMKYGTSNHSTGLGAESLSLFIRLLIEKPFARSAFYQN